MTTVAFQQGMDGYSGTSDTILREARSTRTHGEAAEIIVDSSDSSSQPIQGLLRFGGLFGTSAGQILPGSTILSAQLELHTTNSGDGASVYQMLRSWSEADTWDSLEGGIQVLGGEVAATREFVTGPVSNGTNVFDVTHSLQNWAAGQSNFGWAFLEEGPDGWLFSSSEGLVAPRLTVSYAPAAADPAVLSLAGPVSRLEGDDGSTRFSFTVMRSGDSSAAVTVDYAVTGSGPSPADADDFAGGALPQGTLAFTAGETSKTINIDIAGELLFEADETFTLTLNNPSGGTLLETDLATGTIQNDDEDKAAPTTVAFQQGMDGYSGTSDTILREARSTRTHGEAAEIIVDSSDSSSQPIQGLLRFGGLFGTSAGQILPGSTILSAQLELHTTNSGDGASVYQMLRSWSEADTWDSLEGGIQVLGGEVAATREFVTGPVSNGTNVFDVTHSLQNWAAGQSNFGWAFLEEGPDGWLFSSSEGLVAPRLTVSYAPAAADPAVLSLAGPVSRLEGDDGSTRFSFTVMRSGDSSAAVTVDYAVTGSGPSPADADDFAGGALPQGTLAFTAGETSKTINIDIAGELLFEADETFTLTLNNPSGGTLLETDLATGTIQNDDAREAFHFAAFADYGRDNSNAARVADLVTSKMPDIIITAGDNVHDVDLSYDLAVGQHYSDYIGNYNGVYGPGSPENRFFPSIGNHDYSDPGSIDPYLEFFTLPENSSSGSGNERYYSFTKGPVQFFAVNSNWQEPDGISSASVQAEWLKEALAASESPWKVVYFHHTPFSSGGATNSVDMRWKFEEWGASAVITGHQHHYERLLRDDNADSVLLPYFVVGLGGASRGPIQSVEADGSEITYNSDYGALFVEATESKLDFEFWSVAEGGTLIDNYSLQDYDLLI